MFGIGPGAAWKTFWNTDAVTLLVFPDISPLVSLSLPGISHLLIGKVEVDHASSESEA
jgi:hypothetical protein